MTTPIWGLIPFIVMLACIACFPLIPRANLWWEHPKNQLAVALMLGGPVALWLVVGGDFSSVADAGVEYFQFISLLLALFIVSGGIHLRGDIEASPRNNALFLGFGALIASFIGTTGAAMLLVRPILNTNAQRKYVAHTIIFAIFIVANCGGLLTPLGDPPLFLGMLRGVPFSWTFGLFPHWLLVNALLLFTYYALDHKMHRLEDPAAVRKDLTEVEPLKISGAINFIFFAVIIVSVALLPSIDMHAIEQGHADWLSYLPIREAVMLAAAWCSLRFGPKQARYTDNQFVWDPILEVAAIFVGIFLTMIPALKYLAQIAPRLPLNELTFYWITGGLSSFLDNAPTYATFYSIAEQLPGDPRVGAGSGVPELYLVAISLGAVFFGALTYIGNGPNFMVKSVAESSGVQMPSFGGYLRWSGIYLLPILFAVAALFVAQGWLWRLLGATVIIFLVVRAFVVARQAIRQ